ncbi:serine hydrolase [Zeaxanthinibacter sp. PT1]|uniref:serine hydrolase domain-containing protein n=1 Tax=Zeaxanthinibacter TaxID=561554 RepID=UPI00234B8816|nr:serine hydrolase domain-containing protein [Zeaxanthinibacter sp. PT1]MDC6350485.1 serine hydrolase [Zeaxanthinibacter sp. PT1]
MKKLLSLLLLLVIASCQQDSKKKQVQEQELLAALEIRLDSIFAQVVQPGEPGAALMVAYDGEILVGKGYGLRDLERKEPINMNTNMRMGSVSKQFTALAVLALVDQGKLSLSDTVYSIYPFEIFKNVTIEQLVHHTSGLADAEDAFFSEWDSTKIAENKDVVAYYEKNPPSPLTPGTEWQYNNGTYELLAAIVEKVSGQDFAAFAEEHIFKKAGMNRTHFFNLARPIEIKKRAFCYEKDSLGQWQKVDGHFLYGLLGAGGMYTSISDYFAYTQALRNRKIFSPETHDLIFQADNIPIPGSETDIKFFAGTTAHYAKGWEVAGDLALHGGRAFGANTFVIHHRERSLDIAIFMNNDRLFGSSLIEDTYRVVMEYLEEKD